MIIPCVEDVRLLLTVTLLAAFLFLSMVIPKPKASDAGKYRVTARSPLGKLPLWIISLNYIVFMPMLSNTDF